jgi:predicted PurR-regulated permease PerM
MPAEVHKLSFLHILASVVLVIGSLYWARAVFVPLALSLMLTFLLQPVVAVLHRRGLGYAPAAALVVLLVALFIVAIGWVAVTQLSSLASELPRYQDNLKQKIEDLQQANQGGVFGKIQERVAELSRNFQKRQLPATGPQEPIAVTPPWSSLLAYVPSFLGFLVDAGLVLILLLFMLIAHQDLRDRLFRLVGYGRVTVTTKALDEAGQRISSALRMASTCQWHVQERCRSRALLPRSPLCPYVGSVCRHVTLHSLYRPSGGGIAADCP